MIIENAIIIALIVLFVQATTWNDMIFEKIGDWAESNLPEKIYLPLIGCPICMTPWHGIAWIAILAAAGVDGFEHFAGPTTWSKVITVVATVFVAAGINCFSVMAMKRYELNQLMVDEMEMPDDDPDEK